MFERVVLIRHSETAWSLAGRHTGRTEIPLTESGERSARCLQPTLAAEAVGHVFTSPRERARRTCELSGLGAHAVVDPELAEWDYGDYEGLRSSEILKTRRGWNLFRDGCPKGETPEEISARADRVIGRIRALDGAVALFSHGHFLRVLAVRWVGLSAEDGARLMLDPASVSVLGYEHGAPSSPAIGLWNRLPATEGKAPA